VAVDLAKTRAFVRQIRRTVRLGRREFNICFVTDREMERLNGEFRGRRRPTDVLSFGLEEDSFVTPPGSGRQLGEIVISYPTAARQAEEAGHSVEEELAHLLVHGFLHLLGYDHEAAADGRRMRAREDALLGTPHAD